MYAGLLDMKHKRMCNGSMFWLWHIRYFAGASHLQMPSEQWMLVFIKSYKLFYNR